MKEKWSPNHLEEPYKNDLNLILNEQGNQPFESMRQVSRVSSFLVCLLATSCVLFPPCIGGDSLAPGRPLADDGDDPSLTSAAGTFKLGFFSPVVGSNSRYVGIWYPNISEQTVVWVANRQRPLAGRSGSLSITSDGRLVITDENSSAIVWSSGSLAAPLANPVAQLLDDGNLVVRDADDPDRFAWQSFDFPTDTLLPGMKMGWNLTSRLNRNLTAWRSASDPAAGEYTAGIDLQGDPQVFLWKGAKKYTRGGSWNGLSLSGVPETVNAYDMFDFQFVIDSQEVAYSYTLRDPAIITRLVINQSGVLQRFVWIKERNLWNLFWFRPKDQCDGLSPCGPNGVCSPNDWPMCHCLQGFRPKNPNNWDLRDSSDGCLRKTELDCLNGTDGFVTLSNAKLPDTSSSVVDWSISLDQCKVLCSTNCSCTAYATANISGSGSGCIMWTTDLTDLVVFPSGSAQDLYVKLAAADLELASTDSRPSHVVVVAVVVPLAIILLAFIVYCIWKRKKTSLLGTSSFTDRYIDHGTEAKDLDLPLFDLCTIAEATSDFSRDNKLGEGGFGPVYKGNFGEEQRIAVKRLSKTSMQGVDEFKNEVTLIAKLQHRNLVRLLGCCIQGDERMLVYEYMPNGSLDAILFDKNKAALLDWQARHNIIIGVARGLLYLHQDSRFRIIHRDLKASNILLDEDMNPKISDFGMARIFGGDETESNTRRVVGTYGYMSPEYAMHGIFSTKSDVFSFGVLVLEIVSGKKNRGVCQGSDHLNLLGYIWSLWQEGKGSDIVDQMIEYSLSLGQVLRCINIGLLCVQERPEDRPTMASIVLMLSSNDSELPQPKQPGFVVTGGTAEIDSSTSNQESLSKNNVSVTLLEGR